MQFTKDDFLSCIDIINNKNYDYGNDILYRHCGFDCLPKPGSSQIDTKLSSIIWLIGKAYSADPTRSAPANTFSNKGLGNSFEQIAQKVYGLTDEYSEFYESLKKLRAKNYSFDSSRDDQETLLKTVQLVDDLNKMLRAAMTSLARDKNPDASESENVMSFCSKFLHFMCPQLFFIYDSFSFSGGSALFGKTKDRVLDPPTAEVEKRIRIDNDAKKFFKAKTIAPLSNDFTEPISSYYKHCLRAYALASFLKKSEKECAKQIADSEESRYMPRLVDSILMRITKETVE